MPTAQKAQNETELCKQRAFCSAHTACCGTDAIGPELMITIDNAKVGFEKRVLETVGEGRACSRRASNCGLISDTSCAAGAASAATAGSTVSTLMQDKCRAF